MPGAVAPWLADLEEDWIEPTANAPSVHKTSASHDANSLTSARSRIPRRSSGAYSSASGGGGSLQRRRQPLSQLSSSVGNSLRDGRESTKAGSTGSGSVASAGSVMHYDSVARPKSASPHKQETLEWKRRLVKGDVGYGDQTDLFGPSGLENIFQSPARPQTGKGESSPLPRRRFLEQNAMPSSPPPWPSSEGPRKPADSGEMAAQEGGAQETDSELQEASGQSTWEDQSNLLSAYARESEQSVLLEQSIADNDGSLYPSDSASTTEAAAPAKPFANASNRAHHGHRKTSGQSDSLNEDFSPVYISKHTTVNGDIGYAALESHIVRQMQAMDLQSPAPLHRKHTQPTDESSLPLQNWQASEGSIENSIPSMPEVSLPENLPTGTPPITRLGSFVNVNRGGLSNYGSFKTRPLSPSQSEHLSLAGTQKHTPRTIDAQQSIPSQHASAHTGSGSTTPPPAPTTPVVRPSSPLLSPPKTRPSASPLKLFANYDTFTNNRLLRRMSQLEDADVTEASQEQGREYESHDNNEAAMGHNPVDEVTTLSELRSRQPSKLSNFGEGELDERDFSADFSFSTGVDLRLQEPSSDGSPPPQAVPPGSRTPFRFHVEDLEEREESSNLKRKLSKRSTLRSRISAEQSTPPFDRSESVKRSETASPEAKLRHFAEEEFDEYGEGKRPRSSPIKAPTPKRRRTLHALEMEEDIFTYSTVAYRKEGSYQEIQHSESTQYYRRSSDNEASDVTMARRDILRPRNPTPSQTRRQQVEQEVRRATAEFMSDPPRLDAIQEQLEHSDLGEEKFDLEKQAKAVASEVAAFTLKVSKAETEGERKRSITTQDFLDEAMHIMSMIRAKGRPASGLGSVEESDAENAYGEHLHPENASPSPSPLRLSRPPSREGRAAAWRPRSQNSQDPRVVSQLRRYQENDDINLVDTSLQSLHLQEEQLVHIEEQQDDNFGLASSVNIRISGPQSERLHRRGESDASQPAQGDSFKTNLSVDSSSGRTINTSSTRRSENVATLAPETVAHLIPEEVAGMTFDREKQTWVRVKSQKRRSETSPTPASNITSDDDPFGNIPDLTVDEVKEMHRISGLQEALNARERDSIGISVHDQAADAGEYHVESETRTTSQETTITRPFTRDNAQAPPFASSSVPSRYSALASSEPQIETRATSWSNEELACMQEMRHQCAFLQQPAAHPQMVQVEQGETTMQTFDEEESLNLDDSDVEELPAPKQDHSLYRQGFPGSSSVYRGAARNVSLRRQTMERGYQSHVQDQSELSFIAELPDRRLMSLSLSVSRPSGQNHELAMPPSSPSRIGATLYLSDLPDFSMNQIDEARPSEQALAKRVAKHEMETVDDRYAMAVRTLVKTLTDVESDEPYWEDLKTLQLRNRDLDSVHGLEDFCFRVEDLDVSKNMLTHLEGVPNSIRRLNARSNALSSLTAWGHLLNLQYMDISNNELDSLDGLAGLVHLRELKADDNEISNLAGVLGFDGLLKLSLKRNNVATVDFDGCEL